MKTLSHSGSSKGKTDWEPMIDGTYAVGFLISTGWLTSFLLGSERFPLTDGLPPVAGYLVSVALALLLTVWTGVSLYRRRLNFLPVRHLGSQRDVSAHKVLIACLSSNTTAVSADGERVRVDLDEGPVFLSRDLTREKDSEKLRRWNWQQLLRAVAPHATDGELQQIYLICSQESITQADDCRLVLNHFLGESVQIHVYEQGVDFENLEALYKSFNDVIHDVTGAPRLTQADIMIDATGGQKTASIAAALVTLHHPKIEFQYVSTHGNCTKVISYNVVTTNPVQVES